MPVSLSEWRVRIGTFVHWIREYEVKERRERLLKERIRRLKVLCERLEAKRGDSGEESEDDKRRQDGSDTKGCPHKTANIRSSGNSSDIRNLLTSCDQCIQDLLTASDSHIKEILTPSGCSIKELITPNDCSIKELITPNDCSIKSPKTLNGSTIKDVIKPNDYGIKGLLTTNDSRIQKLVEANDDSRIQDLVKANDNSRIQDLLKTNYSSITKDVIVSQNASTKPLDIPNDSSTKELTLLNASSIKELITPNDSSCIIDLITSEYYNVKDLITSNDSKIDSLLTPNETNIKRLIKPDDDFIEKQLAQAYDYVKTCTSDDESIEQDRQVGDSEEQQMFDCSISPRHSLSDASLRELLTSSYPSTKDVQTPTDYLNADLLIKTSYIKEHENQSDGSVQELPSPGSGTTVCGSFAPYDDFLVELLKPTVSASKDLTSIDLCCHEHDRQNEPFSEESGELPHFVGKEQHPQPDTFIKEATEGELKEHRTSLGSCKKSQIDTSILMAVKRSPVVPFVSKKFYINDRYGEKQMGESASSCHGPSLKSKTDLISGQIPSLSELLLLKSGDVELNPGPHGAAGWSLELEREVLSLVKDVSPVHYYDLCNALDFSHAQSQVILTKNLLDVSNALFDVIYSWGVKQRDGTNYKSLLAEKLKSVHLDALATKLEEDPIMDTSQRVMTEAQVLQCGDDLKTFYREQMCKINPDPLDFNIIVEFEQIYTNLTLLRKEMGTKGTKVPLDYTDLLSTKINGVLPKRLLVEGEGGAGKTTFCSKIAWDWVNGSPEFQRFSWVLVIPLRNVVKGQTIGDIMKNYLSDSNAVSPKQIDTYILSQPTKVLIVLDGLDEYDGDLSDKDSADISQIIRLQQFKECIVLVTTRPWRADKIKSNKELSKTYAFIAVEGFSAKNVSTYISKYFLNDEKEGSELIRLIEVNDVIKENMAPFPIYVAMLCILWGNVDSEKREQIRRLKTFSQLFEQMIMFLGDHYVSKAAKVLHETHLEMEMENIKLCLQRIGSIAFSGLLDRKLVFNEKDFSSCKEAMETCCRIGVLSRENRKVSGWTRTSTYSQPITTSVFFPHKLFQEYVASVYLASLYGTYREEYRRSMIKVRRDNPQEFRYLLYFTAARGKEVGLDIVQLNAFRYLTEGKTKLEFLVDVTFEAYNRDTANAVGQRIFADERILTFDEDMTAHTTSGYLFIMEQHGMETLVLRNRSFGPTVSRDLADFLFTSNSLSRLELYRTTLDHDFYLQTQVSTMAGDKFSIKELIVDHQFLNGLQKFKNGDINVTIGDLFPSLTQLTFATTQTVSPGDVERLAHSNLAVLSIERSEEWKNLVPLVGEPASLGQLFSSSFPQLTCLTFRELVMGNIRSAAILRNLKNHLHLKSISIISCFTDNGLNSQAKQIATEKRMKLTLQHKQAQKKLSFGSSIGPITMDMIDALYHRTCVRHLEVFEHGVQIAGEECFSGFHSRKVDSKIRKLTVGGLFLKKNQSASRCLGNFFRLLPNMTDLDIDSCDFHDDFYKEIAGGASSSQIQKLKFNHLKLHNNQSASSCLWKFISILPHLTDLEISSSSLHGVFNKEIADRASSSQIQKFKINDLKLHNNQCASRCLGKFISILPHLTDLEISSSSLHGDFNKEIADRASSSQIQKLKVNELKLHNNQLASSCLGKFINTLPHLTDLGISSSFLHDDFYKEIADRASSSKIQTVNLYFRCFHDMPVRVASHSASKQLAKFLCTLPCLTNLVINMDTYLCGVFFSELRSLSPSSQNPYFKEKKHTRMPKNYRSARKPNAVTSDDDDDDDDDGDRVDDSLEQRPGKRQAKTFLTLGSLG